MFLSSRVWLLVLLRAVASQNLFKSMYLLKSISCEEKPFGVRLDHEIDCRNKLQDSQ